MVSLSPSHRYKDGIIDKDETCCETPEDDIEPVDILVCDLAHMRQSLHNAMVPLSGNGGWFIFSEDARDRLANEPSWAKKVKERCCSRTDEQKEGLDALIYNICPERGYAQARAAGFELPAMVACCMVFDTVRLPLGIFIRFSPT